MLDALYIHQGREIRSLLRLIDKKELSGMVRAFLDSAATPATRPALTRGPAIPATETVETVVVDGELAEATASTLETSAAAQRAEASSQGKLPRSANTVLSLGNPPPAKLPKQAALKRHAGGKGDRLRRYRAAFAFTSFRIFARVSEESIGHRSII